MKSYHRKTLFSGLLAVITACYGAKEQIFVSDYLGVQNAEQIRVKRQAQKKGGRNLGGNGNTVTSVEPIIPLTFDRNVMPIGPQEPILESFLYCEVIFDEIKYMNSPEKTRFAFITSNLVPLFCKEGTIQMVSFFKKRWLGKILTEGSSFPKNIGSGDYSTFRLCYLPDFPKVASIRGGKCPSRMKSSATLYAMRSSTSITSKKIMSSLSKSFGFKTVSILQRGVYPFDSRFVINDYKNGFNAQEVIRKNVNDPLLNEFERVQFDSILVPFAGPAFGNIKGLRYKLSDESANENLSPSFTIYGHYTDSSAMAKKLSLDDRQERSRLKMYKFSTRKYSDNINYETDKKIRTYDLLNFNIFKERQGQSNLELLSLCVKKLIPYEKSEDDQYHPNWGYQISLGESGCKPGWHKTTSGYVFSTRKSSARSFPSGSFPIYIFERTSYPYDSLVSKSLSIPEGFRLLSDYIYVLPLPAKQRMDDKLNNLKIKSTEIYLAWKKTSISGSTSFRNYTVRIYPFPTNWQKNGRGNEIVLNGQNSYTFTDLDPETTYEFKVMTKNKLGKNYPGTTFFLNYRTSAPIKNIDVSSITSSDIGLNWDQNTDVDHYSVEVVKISRDDEISLNRNADQPEVHSETVDHLQSNTVYSVKITGMAQMDGLVTTDSIEFIVKTSPSPPVIHFEKLEKARQARIWWAPVVDDSGSSTTFDQFEFQISGNMQIEGLTSKTFDGPVDITIYPPRNSIYEMSLRAIDKNDPKRSTDIFKLRRVYSLCQYGSGPSTNPEIAENYEILRKLNCKPKYINYEHTDGFDWMFTDNNVSFITFEGGINPENTDVLHLQDNLIDDVGLITKLIDASTDIIFLNLQNNRLSYLRDNMFKNNRFLQKVNLDGNLIKSISNKVLVNSPPSLFKLSFISNPISVCGISRESLSPVRKSLTVLDLTTTFVNPAIRKLLLARDLENVDNLDDFEYLEYIKSIGGSAWSKLCEYTV